MVVVVVVDVEGCIWEKVHRRVLGTKSYPSNNFELDGRNDTRLTRVNVSAYVSLGSSLPRDLEKEKGDDATKRNADETRGRERRDRGCAQF